MHSWLVFIHLVGLVLFAIAHGASMFLAFRIRAERNGTIVAGHLATSQMAVGLMYVGLLLLVAPSQRRSRRGGRTSSRRSAPSGWSC